jgi:uncharacterized repeat protein (TIGR01451 family)
VVALTALASASLTGISLAVGPADTAQAAPGNPGTPSAPTVLYQEDFQNGSGLTGLTSYVSDIGTQYTADSYWLNTHRCNGFVLSYDTATPDLNQYCNTVQSNFNEVRDKAYALGFLNSPQNPTANRALSTNSAGNLDNNTPYVNDGTLNPSNGIEFATRGQLPLPQANGRFVTFSVDAAATFCGNAQPLLRFYLRNAAGTELPVSSSAINPCTAAGNTTITVDGASVSYGRFPANGSQLLTGNSVGVVLRNEQPETYGNDGAIDNIRVLDVTPQLDKAFSPTRVETGGTSTLTFTVTNTSELAEKDGWSFTDSLPDGLTVAGGVGGTCAATTAAPAGGSTITVTNGQLDAGATSCTITVPVTSDTAGSYTNGPDNVTEVGLDAPGSSTVSFTDPSYTVQKSVNVAAANPGTPVEYSVQVTNTGEWAYNADAPAGLQAASFTDDLSDVLDDATYVAGSASDGATVDGTTLTWSGTLAVGQTRTITYSVLPNRPDAGNGTLNNAVTPTGSGGSCVPGECTTVTPVQSLQVTKTANRTDVLPGQTITYTITAENTGTVDYTAASPASFTDDLSSVLDDAVYNDDAASSDGPAPTYDEPVLSWSGPIAAGDTVTVTYTVTVNDPDTGDSLIDNTVVSDTPGSNCAADSTDPTCTVSLPSSSYTVAKTASAATANPGDTITYTVTVTNTGQEAYTADRPASFTDDLTNVLDDATYNDDATNGATVDGSTLTWAGPLAIGATTTVTYSVIVNDPDTGDDRLVNAVTPTGPGGRCSSADDCTTATGVRAYTVQKTTSAANVVAGDTLTYTVTVTNTGQAAFTTENPATFTDDLTDVLDDATYNDDATGGATVDGVTLSWSGQLAVGQVIQIRYSVTVNDPDSGDQVLTNAVSPTGPGGSCTTAGGCTTDTPVRAFTVAKQASAATATPGARVTYTVTVTNTGGGAYTTDSPASFTDDLTEVLDDATYTGDADASAGVTAFTSPTLTWAGPLPVDGTVTVTYTVTVNTPDAGDHVLTNAVTPTGPGGTCTTEDACTTSTPVQSIAFTKTADTDKVIPEDEVVYTITAENTGQVAYTDAAPASFTDDLTEVLDDATYNNNADATAGETAYQRPTLTWSGPVAIGQTVTITYSVTVNTPDTGDKVLDNAVVSDTPGSDCTVDSSDPNCRSVVPAGSYTVQKTASNSTATQGSTITYTVTVTNTGRTDYTTARPASFQDNLIQVLDDATYNGDATATAGTTAYQRPNLTWSGPLKVGGTVTVTYSATVNTPDTGDRKVINAVAPTGPGGACATAAACTTNTDVPPGFTVHTGGTATIVTPSGWWIGLTGMGITALFGCAVMWVRRRMIRA